MNTRAHIHEEVFTATPEDVFSLLYTPSAIRQWWEATRVITMPQPDGFWCAAWGDSEDEPDYTSSATIEVFEPPRRLVLVDYKYVARTGGLPFDADFTVEFLITPVSDGASLRVTQDGFPAGKEGDAFLDSCDVGWRETFKGIRRFLSQ